MKILWAHASLSICKALATIPLLSGLASVATEAPWYETVLVGMEVGPTGAQFGGSQHVSDYARDFNGRHIVRRCLAANAEYLVLWVRDSEFTFHNSDLLPKPPSLGDRDVLREAAEEARRHNLPLIAYCQLQYPACELRQHPQWKARDAKGDPINHLVCFNSPYTNRVKRLLAELLDYGIDGFHLDMVDQGFGPPHGCWCDRCQELFMAEHEMPMPDGVDWEDEKWDRMLQFRYATSDRLEMALTEHVHTLNPNASVDFNYHGSPPFSWEVGQTPVTHANNGHFVTGEAGQWAFGALAASFNAAWYRAATPGNPFQVAVQRGVRMYHDQTTRPLQDMRWEMFTLLAHGAFVTMIDKTAYDGWLDPVAYQRIGTLLGEAREMREHFGHQPVCEVGIYFSVRTRDWYGRGAPSRYFQSVQGAHKACVYEHLGFGFLFDENVTPAALERFAVVCLPNAAILSAEEVQLFRQFAEKGGQLLITGQSGQYDARGRPLPKSMLAQLVGAEVKGRLPGKDNWIRFEDSGAASLARRLAPSGHLDWPFLVMGPATVYRPTTARPVGQLMDSHRGSLVKPEAYNRDWPLSARDAVGPAVLINRVGKGRVLTLAASPDFATAGEHHIAEARRFFANAARLLNPEPRVHITAPANVEAVVTDDPESRILRVHLIAYSAPPQTTPAKDRPFVLPGLMEDPPMFRAEVEVREAFRKVEACHQSTQVERRNRRLDLTVQDTYEIVIIHY
jgi:hypothetical protein